MEKFIDWKWFDNHCALCEKEFLPDEFVYVRNPRGGYARAAFILCEKCRNTDKGNEIFGETKNIA